MKVLVTGGTGVIGAGVLAALRESGHEVRLLTRHADEAAMRWPGVEPVVADIVDAASLRGTADGCDAIVHVAGIAQESGELTFDAVNVGGTRNVLSEAARAGVRRFVHVSSLGADRGSSDYHRSKLDAERLVEVHDGDWIIVRPGNVYGPGDTVISSLLVMVRVLPVIPLVGDGSQPFQPIWYMDAGRAITACVEGRGGQRRVLELAGPDETSMVDLVERLGQLTGRSRWTLQVPSAIVGLAARAAEAVGAPLPIDSTKLTMLEEDNRPAPGHLDVLERELGVRPTSLADGLRLLADQLPEQLPASGVGPLMRKAFWADIEGSQMSAKKLMRVFRAHCGELIPVEFGSEPGTPVAATEGAVLTGRLPLRGTFQTRVLSADNHEVVMATVEGHPLAGIIRFAAEQHDGRVRFLVQIFARARYTLDLAALAAAGSVIQQLSWVALVSRMVEVSGGHAPAGVQQQVDTLEGADAAVVERWIESQVTELKRHQAEDLAPLTTAHRPPAVAGGVPATGPQPASDAVGPDAGGTLSGRGGDGLERSLRSVEPGDED